VVKTKLYGRMSNKQNAKRVRRLDVITKAKASALAQQKKIHKLAAKQEKKFIAIFNSSVKLAQNKITIKGIEAALKRGKGAATAYGEKAVMEFGASIDGISKPMYEAMVESGTFEATEISSLLAGIAVEPAVGGIVFDSFDAQVLTVLRKSAAKAVTSITEGTRAALKHLIISSFGEDSGRSTRALAREIMGVIGLNEKQAKAVTNLNAKLIKQGVSPSQIDKKIASYSKRLLRERSHNIARTETMKAIGEGRAQAWKQAEKRGLVKDSEIQREWITARDELVCEICAPMDGEVITGAKAVWTLPNGEKRDFAWAHNLCRCTENIRIYAF